MKSRDHRCVAQWRWLTHYELTEQESPGVGSSGSGVWVWRLVFCNGCAVL